VTVQGGGVELGEHVDLGDARVDAVGHGHVDEAVGAANGHGGLCARLGEGEQAGASASAKDDGCTGAVRHEGGMQQAGWVGMHADAP